MSFAQTVLPIAATAITAAFGAPEIGASLFASDAAVTAGATTAADAYTALEATDAAADTATSVGSVFSSAGGGLSLLQGASGAESILGGIEQSKVNKANTAENLQYEQGQEAAQLTEQKVNLERSLGSEQAAYGASGVDVNRGSPLQVQQFSQGQGLLEQALGKYQSVQRQNQIEMQGYQQQNEDYSQIGKGATSLFSAGTGAYNKGFFGTSGLYPTIASASSS